MRIVTAFVTGLIFGLGLVILGMANPAKVLNFLDFTGSWDPGLAFVMGGAVIVTFLGYRLAWKRSEPLLAGRFELPTRTELDPRLMSGAALFGIGWGLGGYCPGPALTAVSLAAPETLIFVVAMIAGMWLARAVPQTVLAADAESWPGA